MMSQVNLDAIEQEVRLCFIQEDAPEHLATLERGVLLLNQVGEELFSSGELPQEWREMMRAAHTLKGGAALSQLQGLSELAHRVEDLLQAVGDRRVNHPQVACELLIHAIDEMRVILIQAMDGQSDPSSGLLDELKIFLAAELKPSDEGAWGETNAVSSDVGLIRTVLESDFKGCLKRALSQLKESADDLQTIQILTEMLQECEVLAEVLGLSQLYQHIQTIKAELARKPAHLSQFAIRVLKRLEQERQGVLKQLEQSPQASPTNDKNSSNGSESSVREQPDSVSQELSHSVESLNAIESSNPVEDVAEVGIGLRQDEEPDQFQPVYEHVDQPLSLEAGDLPFTKSLTLEHSSPAQDSALAQTNGQLGHLDSHPTDFLKEEVKPPSVTETKADNAIQLSNTQVNLPAELTMRVPVRRLDQLADTVGEMLITYESLTLDQRRLQHTNKDLKKRTRQFNKVRERIQTLYDQLLVPGWNQALDSSGIVEFDPLEMDQFTDLHSVLQDFQELLARIEEGTQDIDVLTQSNLDITENLRKQLGDLRQGLTEARMVPFSTLADRFHRPLWDLNQRYGKSVQLIVEGGNTPIDRAVLENLYDPMLHLIRNAFDHGIEDPEERIKHSKSPEGSIRIAAIQQGTQIIIVVQDDGQGIDFDQVQRRAFQMNLLPREQVTSQRLLQCLFVPGFSTVSEVSELSGRGVGLDVVKAEVEKLRGSIQVESTPGQGTQFKLAVPLTLNIMPLLVCQRFLPRDVPLTLAIPSSHVLEIIEMPHLSPKAQTIHWRDQDIPYLRLEQIMQRADRRSAEQSTYGAQIGGQVALNPEMAVVLTMSRQSVAIGVNRLLGEQEMVLKTFDTLVNVPAYFPGCTVLPSGQVVPMLAPAPLEDWFQNRLLQLPSQGTGTLPASVHNQDAIAPAAQQLALASASSVQSTPKLQSALEDKPTPDLTPPSDLDHALLPLHTPPTVMVVDDSVAARRWMVRSLERAGYQVIQCRDGQDALETLNKGIRCQLVICDIEMPRLNGFQFLAQIRQDSELKALPVVMLTSRQGDRHRQQASQLGANGYFIKPLGGQQLLLKITDLVKTHQS